MRYLSTTLLFLLLPWWLAAQISSTQYPDWQHFRKTGTVTSAAQTSTDIWFALSGHLLRIDKATQKISYGGSPYHYFDPGQIQQLWVGADDQLFLLEGETTIAQWEEETWTRNTLPFNFAFFKMDKILHRREDGEFVCQGSTIDVLKWKIGSNPSIATEIQYPAPWTIQHIVWEPQFTRYWISNDDELGHLQGDVFTPILLPENAGKVEELQLDRDGLLWVRTERLLLKRDENTWAVHELPPNTEPDQISFATLGNGAALLASEEEKTLLRPTTAQTFTTTDYSTELATLDYRLPYIFDDNETLWWIDEERKAVSHWREGQTVLRQEPGFWLPFDGDIDQLTSDQEGRIWLTGDFQSYFYANHRWWPATALYPGFPDSVKQVAFNSQCYPAVLRSSDESRYNISPELYQLFGSEWIKLPDGRAENPSLNDAIGRLWFDRNDHLIVQRPFSTNAQIWAYGTWSTFLTTDFFPLPARIYDIEIAEDNSVYLITDLGLFVDQGQYYQHYSFEELGIPVSVTVMASISFSPSGTLWITYNNKLYRKTDSGYENIAPDYLETPLEPLRLWDIFTETRVFADDDIWVIAYGLGILHYDGTSWSFYDPNNAALPTDTVDYLAKDDRGRIWMSDTQTVSILTSPSTGGSSALAGTSSFSTLKTYPNPACCQVQASWLQSELSEVSLRLYNNQGQLLRTLVDESLPPGEYTYTIERQDLPAGIYYLQLLQGQATSVEEIFWK